MDKEIIKEKIDEILSKYKENNKYEEDLIEFENNSIEDEKKTNRIRYRKIYKITMDNVEKH